MQSKEEILGLTENLSVEEKAELIEKLLSGSGLSVVLGNNQMSAQMVVQINMMSKDELGDILRAVATKIATEGRWNWF